MKRDFIKRFILTYIHLLPLVYIILFCYIWLSAFFNGGSIVVNINTYKEMYPELILLLSLSPMAIGYIILSLRKVLANE